MTIPYSSPNYWGPCVLPNLISRRVQILPPHSNHFDLNQRSRYSFETYDVLNLFVKYLSKFSHTAICYVSALLPILSVMSILDHLWDDTVAGPRPENGLGKLRKHPTFPTRSISDKGEGGNVRSYSGDSPEDAMKVTRSIMIMKPAGYQSNGSAPASPAGSTPPVSPFSGAREPFRFRRRSTSDAYEKEKTGPNRPSPSSPFDV